MQDRDTDKLILQIANMKSYMIYRVAPLPMSSNGLEGYFT